MSKKVLILSGSPRKGGNSDILCDEFLRGAREAGHQLEKVRPTEKKIAPCLGCYYCASHGGECVRRDDMADLLQQMIDADVIVLASPVYFYSINAQLKAVIDRFQRYFEARFARGIRPAIATHRDAVLLLTMGRYDPFAVEVCEKTLRQSFSVMNTTLKKTMVLPDTDRADCENSSIFAKAQEIAIEIAREL
mgnify:CR=1 FL=1